MKLDYTYLGVENIEKSMNFITHIFNKKKGLLYNKGAVQINSHFRIIYSDLLEDRFKQHLAFRVSNKDFDSIYLRLQDANVPFGGVEYDGKIIIDSKGERTLYFDCPDSHIWEVITNHRL